LARGRFHPASSDDTSTPPLIQGRQAGVRFVIAGTYQTIEGMMRVSGQIIDTTTGSVVGGLTATGGARDLFSMEDTLSEQALHQLRKLASQPVSPAAASAATLGPQAAQPAPMDMSTAAPAFMRTYEGSALQVYVNSNRTPSEDYADQVRASADRQTYWNYGYNGNGAYGYGYYGYYWGYGAGSWAGYAYPWYTSYNYPYGFAYGYTTPFVVLRSTAGRPVFFGNDHSLQP
jgi:hypothetical protein